MIYFLAATKYSVLTFLVILLLSCSREINDLKICDRSSLKESNQISFSTTAWQNGNEDKRGQMILDLAKNHKLKNIKPDKIRSLLGSNTCYVNYDDEPCFKVKIGGETKFLAFPVAHSGKSVGNITGAYLRSDPSSLSGCFYC